MCHQRMFHSQKTASSTRSGFELIQRHAANNPRSRTQLTVSNLFSKIELTIDLIELTIDLIELTIDLIELTIDVRQTGESP